MSLAAKRAETDLPALAESYRMITAFLRRSLEPGKPRIQKN